MTKSRLLHPRWPGVAVAVASSVGFAGVAPAQTDATAVFISGTIKEVDGCALPGVTIAVRSLQKTQGGW